MRYDPGVASDCLYFAPAGNFLSILKLFEACFVLRQRKTATVSIEFSKEVKYSMPKEETRPEQSIQDEINTKKALKKQKHAKKNIACVAIGQKEKSPAVKQTLFIFRLDPHIFFGLGLRRKKGRHGKSVVRQAAACLRYVMGKTGFTTKRCASATFHHPFYAMLHTAHTVQFARWRRRH